MIQLKIFSAIDSSFPDVLEKIEKQFNEFFQSSPDLTPVQIEVMLNKLEVTMFVTYKKAQR